MRVLLLLLVVCDSWLSVLLFALLVVGCLLLICLFSFGYAVFWSSRGFDLLIACNSVVTILFAF